MAQGGQEFWAVSALVLTAFAVWVATVAVVYIVSPIGVGTLQDEVSIADEGDDSDAVEVSIPAPHSSREAAQQLP